MAKDIETKLLPLLKAAPGRLTGPGARYESYHYHWQQICQALKAAGKTFEQKIYQDAPGGHSFNRIDTTLAQESRREIYAFLEKHLKKNARHKHLLFVLNKCDHTMAHTARAEITARLEANGKGQRLFGTVAAKHHDPGVNTLYDALAQLGSLEVSP